MYYYFGYSTCSTFFSFWKMVGLVDDDWNPSAWVMCVNHSIEENIWQHPNIKDLVPHSRLVKTWYKREISLVWLMDEEVRDYAQSKCGLWTP